jgi:hypothetical protein
MRCRKCGRTFEESIMIGGGNVQVAICGVCPANDVYVVCSNCADLEKVKQSACPQCGARNLWQIRYVDIC